MKNFLDVDQVKTIAISIIGWVILTSLSFTLITYAVLKAHCVEDSIKEAISIGVSFFGASATLISVLFLIFSFYESKKESETLKKNEIRLKLLNTYKSYKSLMEEIYKLDHTPQNLTQLNKEYESALEKFAVYIWEIKSMSNYIDEPTVNQVFEDLQKNHDQIITKLLNLSSTIKLYEDKVIDITRLQHHLNESQKTFKPSKLASLIIKLTKTNTHQ